MSSNEIPEPWASRLVAKGYTDPRFRDDRPSMSALAADVGIHPSTVSSTINGRRAASAETVAALASALGDDVAGWLGVAVHGTWHPPAAANLLTPRQRRALEELIVSMTAERGEEHARSAATKTPEVGPADQPTMPILREVSEFEVDVAAREDPKSAPSE